MEVLQREELKCSHCGDPCGAEVHWNDQFFCCYGCRAVFELLADSNLSQYHQEISKQNASLSQLKAERSYHFLDHEDIKKQIIRFNSPNRTVVNFFLPGIHCSACIYLLEHLPKLDSAILRAEVNFVKREILISFDPEEKSLREVAVLLAQLGYPPDVSLDSLDKTKKHVSKSSIATKVAVAGFCFGNAMLMSMPEYLDQNFLLTDDFKTVFGWINFVLAFPVVFYAASDYFNKAWKGLLVMHLSIDVPIALGILTLFLRSVFEIATQTGSGYVDSLAGLVFFLLVGKWYQGKTYQALSFERDFSSYFPVSVTCVVEGQEVIRPLKDLQKGDKVLIHNDELIPADGKILRGIANVDYSFVTGEAAPEKMEEGAAIFAGGRQKGAELLIQISQTVKGSELTSLWNHESFRKDRRDLHSKIDQVSKYFTLVVILLAVSTGIYWAMHDPGVIWSAVSAVLIVACPCALALVLPFAYGHAMRALGRKGLYLKNAEVVERLAIVDRVIFDKTGTLTSAQGDVSYVGDELDEKERQLLRSALGNSAHPLSRTVHNHLPEGDKISITSFQEETGKGFTAGVGGRVIQVGSAEYTGVKFPSIEDYASRVYIRLGEKTGMFVVPTGYRRGIFQMLANLKKRFALALLSGDHSGEKQVLSPYFNDLQFKQRPHHKLAYVQMQAGHSLMIGDGLNDAGALKEATVGLAIAEDIHQFSPACDGILSAEQVTILPRVLMFGTQVKHIVWIAFIISFLYNVVGLSFAMTGHLTPLISAILMPISSVTVVGFVTLLVGLKARKLP